MFITALNVLPSPRFSHVYPTLLTMNPEDEGPVVEFFRTLDRPETKAGEALAQREFEKVAQILNQVNCPNMYVPGRLH